MPAKKTRRKRAAPKTTLTFLSGGGEMGERMRALDWSATPLGPPAKWPQSLRTTVSLMLTSRYPMFIAWGPELAFLYNDGYRPIFGEKHPAALGQPFAEIWAEIWDDIRPLVDRALAGEATWSEDLQLIMQRRGYAEEVYFTFSYSPVRDESGGIGGMFCACTETTERVIGERRLRLLRDLAARTVGTESVSDACRRVIEVLGEHALDVPFAALYLVDAERQSAVLAGSTGLDPPHLRPERVGLHDSSAPWPLGPAHAESAVQVVPLTNGEHAVRGRAWPEAVRTALVLPVRGQGASAPVALLLAGISPRRELDDSYRGFFDVLAGQVAAALADAQAYEAERRRVAALAEIDRAKTAFFSNVSHEFRTPLTLLLGPVSDAMGDAQVPAPARERLEVAHRNGLRLLKLVNSLLDFARIEAGRVQASYEAVDLAALTRDLASAFRSAMERASLAYVVECPRLREPVYVDREMWERIVLNLLSNALKFTFEGEIAVRMRSDANAAVLEVSDSGVGIPAHELPRLFERFHRVEGTHGRTHEGSGIGLALVQELVKLHGGSIEAQSAVGRGTGFTVRVPYGSAHLPRDRVRAGEDRASAGGGAQVFVQEALRWLPQSAQDPTEPLGADRAGSVLDRRFASTFGARLVLADDNADMRNYLAEILGGYYRIEAVGDGEAALAAIRRERPHLVVSDVMMPRLDGFGLLRAIRGDPALRDVPLILLSARAGEEARVEGLDAGADDYLVKPFSARELLARVGAMLELGQIRRIADERLHLAVEAAHMGVFDIDLASGRTVWSSTHFELLGYPPRADGLATYEQWRERVHPDDLERVEGAWRRACDTGTDFTEEYRIARADTGETRWLSAYGRFLRDGERPPHRSVGVFFDVTERKRVEEALRESEERFRNMADNAPVMVWVAEPDGTCTYLSKSWYEFTGQTPETGLGFGWIDAVHEDEREGAKNTFLGALERTEGFSLEYRLRRRDGQYRWAIDSAAPRFGARGEFLGYIGSVIDITDRKQVEEALRDSEARFRALADNIPILCWMADETGWIFWYNSRWYAYTGTTPEQMEGWGWQSVHDPLALPAVVERWKASLASGTPFEMTFPLKGADGVFRPFLTRIAPVRDDTGRVVRWFGTNTDITQQLAAEEALRQADERKNEFLAMLAHELRNPLAPLRTMGHVLAHHTTDTDTSRRAGQMLHRQVGQLSRLVDDLLDVARITRGTIALRKQALRVEEIVAGAIESVQPALDVKRQQVKLLDAREPLHVDGDAARLAQAIGNLFSNAVKYSPEGSTIYAHVARSGDQAEVRVRDEGVGIEPEVLPQIFDMFFQADRSLDRQQGGLGVGLTIVKKLVELHGGSVEAKSAGRGHGSEFIVRLPLASARERTDDAQVLSRGSPRRQRVLVVDDNVDAADSLAMMLALAQQEVRTANDGPGALRLLEEFSPDVIFVDIGLPGMDGYHVAREIRGRFTSAPPRLYAITGYGREQDRARALESGFDGHFTKPVDPDKLMALISDS